MDEEGHDKIPRRTREIAKGVIGGLGVRVLGGQVGNAFGDLSTRARPGKRFAMYGQASDISAGRPIPYAEQFLEEENENPLVLDKKKFRAERARVGVGAPVISMDSDGTGMGRGGRAAWIGLSSSDAPTAFHEFGHAAKADLLTRAAAATHPHGMIGGGLRMGFLVGALAHPENKPGKFVHDHAAMLTGLTELPLLMEELRASYSALKGLHAVGGRAAVKGGLKVLAPALATYLASAASHVGGVALARHLAGGSEQTKTAAPTANLGVTPKAPAAKMPTLKAGPAPKVTGQLRLSATAANATPVGQLKPKTTPPHPGSREGNFPGIAAAKPPSLTGFYRDSLDSMSAPTRGTRT
jgi:hypothetical protein